MVPLSAARPDRRLVEALSAEVTVVRVLSAASPATSRWAGASWRLPGRGAERPR